MRKAKLYVSDNALDSENTPPRATIRSPSSALRLVEPDGIEPTTSCLQSTRSPVGKQMTENRAQIAGAPNGGARRDRTDDLMLAKHALSQLSYSPVGDIGPRFSVFRLPTLVGLGGLEPPTSRLSSARSNQLSYKPFSED
jgi:hypothetical protein